MRKDGGKRKGEKCDFLGVQWEYSFPYKAHSTIRRTSLELRNSIMSRFETENITKILGYTTHLEPRKKNFSSLFQSQLNSLIFKLTEMEIASNSIKSGSHMPPTYLATKQPALPGILFRHMGILRRRQQDLSQVFAASMPAKFNSSQLRRYDGGKDWDDLCCWRLLFSYRKSIPGSTGDYVAGRSTTFENQD